MATSQSRTTQIRRKSAAVPSQSQPSVEPTLLPYVDDVRDYRDCVVITAIRTALEIVRHDGSDAADILQLALWKMQSSWPTTDEKFTAEVARG